MFFISYKQSNVPDLFKQFQYETIDRLAETQKSHYTICWVNQSVYEHTFWLPNLIKSIT